MRTHQIVIIGTGRAGKARKKAVQAISKTALRRSFSIRNDSTEAIEGELQSSLTDLVIVCTENSLHFSFIQKSLLAQKDVLVEFPLVNSSQEAQELFDLAERNNSVLLCECIALLTPAHQRRREMLKQEQWCEIRIEFQANSYRWIEEEQKKGHVGQLAIGRLQAVWDLLGELVLKQVLFLQLELGYQVTIFLEDQMGRKILLEEKRERELSRKSAWFLDGEMFPKELLLPDRPLFESDLERCMQHIQGAEEYYLSKEACLGVLKLAEQISAACHSNEEKTAK